MTRQNSTTSSEKQPFLSGGGEMGELMRSKDWSSTSLGAPDQWPQSLKTVLNILLHSKFPMFLWWGPGLTCFYNDAYRPSLGQNGKHPQILGAPAKEAWAEIWDTIKPLIDSVLENGQSTWSEDQLIPIYRNGKLEDVYWTFSYSPVIDELGKIAGVLVICTETTDKILTYKKLEESKNQLHFAIEAAELGTWDYNPLTNKFTANARLKTWFGLPPEKEIDLDHAINVISEKDRQRIIEAIQKALDYSSGGNYETEYSIINPVTKREIVFRAKGKAWFDSEKKPVRFNGTLEDVTEEVLARQTAMQSEQRFQAAIDAVEGILWTNNAAGEMVGEQPGWAALTGQSYQEYQGYGWSKAVHPDDAQPSVDAWNEALKERRTFVFEHRVKTQAGNYDHFSIRAIPLLNSDGTVREWVGVHTNITNQKKYEAALSESEKQFRNMVMQSPVPMTILRGNNFIIETANHAMLDNIWNMKETEVAGKPLLEVFPELKEQKYAELMNKVFTTGETYREYEAPVFIKIGNTIKKFYLDFEYAPLLDTDRSISGLIITINDITEKVEARIQAQESEQRLRSFVESAPFPIGVYTGKEMRIQLVNQAIINVWGKGADLVGKTYAEVLPELAGYGIYEQLDNVFTTGVPFHAQHHRVDLVVDNVLTSRYFNYSFTPLFDITGKVYGVMNTAADVSDLVTAKEEVEEREKEFRQLADSLPELVWTTDSTGNQLFASKRWKEFTGLDPYDVSTFDQVVHPDDRDNILNIWTNCLASGNIYKTQVRLKSKEGAYQWFYVHGEPIRNEEGKIEKWVGAFTNLNDQKKAEEELIIAFEKIEESEKRFRDVTNSAPVFIWIADIHKQRYFFNRAWFDFTGRTLEQERGNGWIEGVHPEDLERCFQLYDEAYGKQQEYQMEYRLRRHDGEYRWISARGVPRFSNVGIFEGFIGACMDIHEQVIAQKKLKEDEERLNIIVSASDLGTWELNLNPIEVIYSGRYIEIFGYDKNTRLSHKEILAHLHPDDLPKRKMAFETAMATGILHYESRIVAKDKSIRWVENKGKVFYDEQNQAHKIIGTTRDTTEEKNYEQQLLEREQKFRLLADSMPQLVWTGDAEGNLNYFSRAVYDYSGLTAEQIEKDGWLQIVHPDDQEENIKAWKHAVTTGTDFILEHRFGRYDGVYRWQLSRAIPQRDADGKIQMWVGTSTDIQDMKEQDQQKDFFISMASHELKTPITSIKGYVQILQGTYQKSEDVFLKNSLRIIDKQINTLTHLIGDLLDVSKIKSGNLVLDKENFDMVALTLEVIAEITHINPDYVIDFPRYTHVTVYADKGRTGQVLINLLTNAVKYSPNSKKITVTSFVENDQVVVSVQDSGIGISKPDQEKIFERFYRVEGKNEKTFPGFGIGLFIAAEIIKRHHGKIWVESENGKGSVFSFSLPLI